MFTKISWEVFGGGVVVLLLLYYAGLAYLFGREADDRRPEPPPLPPPPAKEEWMEEILSALEETVLHAQAKRYHPDEVIVALQKKMNELKN